jgi:hypothetical protein
VFGDQAGSGSSENKTPVPTFHHSLQHEPREMKRPLKINSHCLIPKLWLLFPDDALVRRSNALIAHEDLDRPQPLLRLSDRLRTAIGTPLIRHRELETDVFQLLPASGDTHHLRPSGRQEFRRCTAYFAASVRDQSYTSLDSRHPGTI